MAPIKTEKDLCEWRGLKVRREYGKGCRCGMAVFMNFR